MTDLRRCSLSVVKKLCELHHGYGSAGDLATYSFAAYENGNPVAAWAWSPPPPGAARSVCPEEPSAVLALSRMVAVPRHERALKHISKPLMAQMKRMIDRGRWPVLVTYSDEGQGHTGYVYQCSGWTKTERRKTRAFVDESGARRSSYANGKSGSRELVRVSDTFIQRWEHWSCKRGHVAEWMASNGWERVAIPGKFWKSGNQAFRFEKNQQSALVMEEGG